MKRSTVVLMMFSLGVWACGGETDNLPTNEPAEAAEGLHFEHLDNTFASGTYRAADDVVRFEVVSGQDFETIRFMSASGQELFRSELEGENRDNPAKWAMWHYGVALDSTRTADDQAELMQWVNSAEAQLVASMWRDIFADYDYTTGPLNGLFRYGVHLEEAMAFDRDGLEDRQEANCNCYGKCGPGCFSIGSTSYCRKHDCCCRTYGSAACYTWCFVNPKCPVSPCG